MLSVEFAGLLSCALRLVAVLACTDARHICAPLPLGRLRVPPSSWVNAWTARAHGQYLNVLLMCAEKVPPSFLSMLLDAAQDPMIIILLIVAAVSIVCMLFSGAPS